MYLEQLVDISTMEDLNMECKARLNRNDIVGWIKTVAGFANAEGGSLFIGVEDKTNKLIGFSRKDADNERNYFNNQLNEHVFPRPVSRVSFIRYEKNGRELYVIRVDVKESVVKPIIVKFNNVPSIYMRRDGFTNGATYEEIIQMSIKSGNTQFDVLESDEPYVREEFTGLLAFYEEHNDGAKLTDKALMSLGFFSSDYKLKNGAILFRDGYQDSKAEVQCSVFSGFNKGSERIVTVNRFKGSLISSIGYMMEFVKQRMNHTFVKLATSRVTIDAFPERALFEGVVNAVAHRDYFLDGTQIQVDMFKDRLEISSPGSFYQGEKMGKTYDLSRVISKRRNELVCGILVKCNVMEAAGTGFDKIVQEYSDADEGHKPYIYSTSDHFTLVLPDLTYAEGIAMEEGPAVEFVPVQNGTDHDEKVLSFCYNGARKASEIAEYLEMSDSSYFRKKVLENLVEHGYLEKEKVAGASYFKTNRDMVGLV